MDTDEVGIAFGTTPRPALKATIGFLESPFSIKAALFFTEDKGIATIGAEASVRVHREHRVDLV